VEWLSLTGGVWHGKVIITLIYNLYSTIARGPPGHAKLNYVRAD